MEFHGERMPAFQDAEAMQIVMGAYTTRPFIVTLRMTLVLTRHLLQHWEHVRLI